MNQPDIIREMNQKLMSIVVDYKRKGFDSDRIFTSIAALYGAVGAYLDIRKEECLSVYSLAQIYYTYDLFLSSLAEEGIN